MRNDCETIKFLVNNFNIIFIPCFSFETSNLGNTRNDINGKNLNNWEACHNNTENYSIKKLLFTLKKYNEIVALIEYHDDMFEDGIHGHMYRKNNISTAYDLFNYINYNMNFFEINKTKFVKTKKFEILNKEYKVRFLYYLYFSIYGVSKNNLRFNDSDYLNFGENIIYSLSLFLYNHYYINTKDKKIVYNFLNNTNKDITDYHTNNNVKDFSKDISELNNKSFGSDKYFIINEKNNEEIEVNEFNNNVDNVIQLKTTKKIKIRHKRDINTRQYDYVIRRNIKNNTNVVMEVKRKSDITANTTKALLPIKNKYINNKLSLKERTIINLNNINFNNNSNTNQIKIFQNISNRNTSAIKTNRKVINISSNKLNKQSRSNNRKDTAIVNDNKVRSLSRHLTKMEKFFKKYNTIKV